MSEEFIRPATPPPAQSHAMGPFSSFLAAFGVGLMSISMLGAAAAATVWAASRLIGLPDTALYVLLALAAIPVLWTTIWAAGRAWHVERRLEDGLDIDQPVFKLLHYWGAAKPSSN